MTAAEKQKKLDELGDLFRSGLLDARFAEAWRCEIEREPISDDGTLEDEMTCSSF